MAVFNKQGLIAELLDRTELVKASTQPFLRLTDEQLNFKTVPGKWSIAEIYGHLDITLDIFIRSILGRTTLAPDVPSETYRSGWLGELLYSLTIPRPDGSVFRMKTLKSYRAPGFTKNAHEVLEAFLRKCDDMDDILRHIATKDMQRIKIPFLYPFIHLRLGDNLRCLVAHSERHLLQAQRVMSQLPQAADSRV
jgi:hypothetical protein